MSRGQEMLTLPCQSSLGLCRWWRGLVFTGWTDCLRKWRTYYNSGRSCELVVSEEAPSHVLTPPSVVGRSIGSGFYLPILNVRSWHQSYPALQAGAYW